MKQIPFYKGIEKKLIVTGPAILKDQTYKCVVYSSLTDQTTTIYTTAVGDIVPPPDCASDCQHEVGTVVFHFNEFQTVKLKLGDNNVAVYDVSHDNDDTDYTLYKVYEARAYASDSIVNNEPYTAITFENASNTTGWLKGGKMVNGCLVLNSETVTADDYLKLT